MALDACCGADPGLFVVLHGRVRLVTCCLQSPLARTPLMLRQQNRRYKGTVTCRLHRAFLSAFGAQGPYDVQPQDIPECPEEEEEVAGALSTRTSLGKAGGGGTNSGPQRCERSGGADGTTPAVSGLLSGNTSRAGFGGGGGGGDGRRSVAGISATGWVGPQSLCNLGGSLQAGGSAMGCETGSARERNSQLLDVLAVRLLHTP